MGCRVGITTDPDRRRAEWESQYRNFRDWEAEGPFDDREDAQRAETLYAQKFGCEAHHGGGEPDNHLLPWFVYYFAHDGRK